MATLLVLCCAGVSSGAAIALTPAPAAHPARRHAKSHSSQGRCRRARASGRRRRAKCRHSRPAKPPGSTRTSEYGPTRAAPQATGGGSGTGASPAATEAPLAEKATSSANPFAEQRFYVNPASAALATEHEWAASGRTAEAAEIGKIAGQPVAEWFGDWTYGHGGTSGDVSWWVSAASGAGALPVLVAYDLPWRDCSGESGGGAASPAAYKTFIKAMVKGIAGRRAVVIVEPDALAELSCLSTERQSSYYALLSYAVEHLSSPAVSVYLDAGHAGWQSPATMATRLRQADVAGARGFSLNVSNFGLSSAEEAYGAEIDLGLASPAHFIIDTSRNGRGPAPGGAWCNPPGRGLGTAPTSLTGNPLVDAYFWVKQPGASDGTCNGGPAAGAWWPEYALGLAQNASW